MTLNLSSDQNQAPSIVINPLHRLPILIMAIGVAFLFFPIKLWIGLVIAGFGFFLLIQSFTLKLKITSDEMIVLQLGQELRRFPFNNWVSWRLFYPKLPGLFYFREKVSPHLLPILFDPEMLEKELRLRVGELEIKKTIKSTNPSEN